MSYGAQTSVADLVAGQQSQLDELDAQIKITAQLQAPGDGGKLLTALTNMRKQRTATYDKTNKAIIASADLGAALAALNTATHNMKTVAVNMTDVTGVLGNAAKYLGYASAAFNAISTVRA